MKLPLFPARKKSPEYLSTTDEEVFAQAKELASLRLEQCIADLQIVVPKVQDATRPPLRKVNLL